MPSTQNNLIDVLSEQIHCAEAMLGTLAEETDALRQGDPEKLNSASASKAKLVEALEQLETERRELTDAMQVTLQSTEGSEAGRKWRRLLELLAECRSTNIENGNLVNARREQITAALKLIRGNDTNGLYDARGHAASSGRTQRLGSA
ncbi:MAG: flagellar protein FlgN [Gammaproteobacteria bacterium]|nr:flagellar protein FlgN [Gammaproteobacteria bacterium]